jgi:hypothetical protein
MGLDIPNVYLRFQVEFLRVVLAILAKKGQGQGQGQGYTTYRNLQTGSVDHLVVDNELTAIVIENENTHASTTVVKRGGKTVVELALVKDGECLLDITGLGHGNDVAVITNVKDTVLLEHRTKHVLDNHRRSRVADEGRLLVEHLGEQVNTEVTVLARLAAGCDANDLAWSTLKDQKVTDADVVAGDGDGVGRHLGGMAGGRGGRGVDGSLLGVGRGVGVGASGTGDGNISLGNYDFLTNGLLAATVLGLLVLVVVVMTEAGSVNGVSYSLGNTLDTTAEAVVVTVVVVIAHITLVMWRGVDGAEGSSFCYTNLTLCTGEIWDGTS